MTPTDKSGGSQLAAHSKGDEPSNGDFMRGGSCAAGPEASLPLPALPRAAGEAAGDIASFASCECVAGGGIGRHASGAVKGGGSAASGAPEASCCAAVCKLARAAFSDSGESMAIGSSMPTTSAPLMLRPNSGISIEPTRLRPDLLIDRLDSGVISMPSTSASVNPL